MCFTLPSRACAVRSSSLRATCWLPVVVVMFESTGARLPACSLAAALLPIYCLRTWRCCDTHPTTDTVDDACDRAFRSRARGGIYYLERERLVSACGGARSAAAMAAWKDGYLDMVLIPLAVLFPAVYHLWLYRAVRRSPLSSTVGISAAARRIWVFSMMKVSKVPRSVSVARAFLSSSSMADERTRACFRSLTAGPPAAHVNCRTTRSRRSS